MKLPIEDLITLEHYKTPTIKDNWKVLLAGIQIGDLHDCDGIGGQLGKFTETELFEFATGLAEIELKNIKRNSVIDEFTDRDPDYSTHGPNGEQSDFWFKEMMMYCHSEGELFVLKWDSKSKCLDHFDERWICLSEEICKQYEDRLTLKDLVNATHVHMTRLAEKLYEIGNDKLGDDCALIAQELDQYEESLNKK